LDELVGGFVVGTSGVGLGLGEEKAGLLQVVVGEMESHAAAGGEDADFVEVVLGAGEVAEVAVVGGSGEEAERKVIEDSRFSETIDGFLEVLCGFG